MELRAIPPGVVHIMERDISKSVQAVTVNLSLWLMIVLQTLICLHLCRGSALASGLDIPMILARQAR